ncbi:RelA/SpoT domain-containing protein [Alphaproteobacteria bacterium KMM 3653]|uniref:RelA/SpoT domain-containing protein n=1 Tax=Harenicola maris TaxID=2841044 RepID=A0AAP2G826_9RHOB|nr:RelA/SpoT domain-containing protein [Harenicola maris]
MELINEWRAAHGYVINTFQAWIKGHIKQTNLNVEFAQRLKRQKTVIDKLKRRRQDGSPVITDVTAMQDLAGCRLIFDNIQDLRKFQEHLRSSAVLRNVRHIYKNNIEKFDYIRRPKATGYRGVHEVLRHFPRGSDRNSMEKKPWDGLLVEVQLRTRVQHAWATAVEISDLVDRERTKFTDGDSPREKFFALASEIVARRHENVCRSFPDEGLDQLEAEADRLEHQLGVVSRLRLLRAFDVRERLKAHNVLNLIEKNGDLELEVKTFKSPTEAIEYSTQLENDHTSINAVYVRADNPAQLKSAYRNYFNDPVAFVELFDE